MTRFIEIYQIRDDINDKRDLSFMNYASITKLIGNIKRQLTNYYTKIYELEYESKDSVTDDTILSELFYKFNMERPEDFRGHSMSVSDIVAIDDKLYFCDSYGWQDIE